MSAPLLRRHAPAPYFHPPFLIFQISTLRGSLSKFTAPLLNILVRTMYLKPKVHEHGNPGRPIISSIHCHTLKISEYVDYHL